MTGELTLTGQVLLVGGIREKIVAARRSNLREVVLPEANQGDYEELPDYLRKGMQAHFVSHFDDVARMVFGSARQNKIRSQSRQKVTGT